MFSHWSLLLIRRHLLSRQGRPAILWMNLFAFVGVFLAVFSWISVMSIMNGLQGEIQRNVLSQKPHLMWEGNPQVGLDSKGAPLRAALGEQLLSARFLLQTEGLLEVITERQKGRIVGSGVLLQGISHFGEGRLSIGSEVSDLLHLLPGDRVRLRSAWKLEIPPWSLEVSDVHRSVSMSQDRVVVQVDRKELNEWLGLENAVSRVEVYLRDPWQADLLKDSVSETLGLPVKTWKEMNASLWYSLKLEKVLMTLLVAFIVILAAFALHLALSMRVAEKTREIGLLKALGAPSRQVRRLFFAEGLFLGGVGALSGLLAARLFCLFISRHVSLPDFYSSAQIPVEWSWSLSAGLSCLTLLAVALASWGPAYRTERFTLSDALRS